MWNIRADVELKQRWGKILYLVMILPTILTFSMSLSGGNMSDIPGMMFGLNRLRSLWTNVSSSSSCLNLILFSFQRIGIVSHTICLVVTTATKSLTKSH